MAALSLGLSERIHRDLERVFRAQPAVERVLVFGSRGRGDYRPESDIDLAVIGPTLGSSEFAQLWAQLESLPLIFKLDVLHWDRLGQAALKERILRDGKVVYEAPPAR